MRLVHDDESGAISVLHCGESALHRRAGDAPERMPKDVNTSAEIVVLVDEAHRTTSGDLGNYLMGSLPNATYVGFTGTPIDKIATAKVHSRSSAQTTHRATSRIGLA